MPDEPPHDDRAHLRTAPGFRARLEWPEPERTYFLGIGPGTFSLHEAPDRAFHFDLEGRLRRASEPGLHWLQGLDGAVLRKVISRGRGPGPELDPPDRDEVLRVHGRSHAAVTEGLRLLRREPPPAAGDAEVLAEAVELLSRAAERGPDRLDEEARRFREAYEPLSLLPPDRYRALILQATIGCSWGRCAFCSLYREVAYRRRSPDEFRDHVRRVKALLGRALDLKSGVFLGEANALELPFDDLSAILRIVGEEVPAQVAPGPGRRGGISAFTDVFQDEPKTRTELEQLRALGLDRVYLGIESGDDAVLRRLRKPSSRRAALDRVASLRGGGVPVGVIFLVGAGGRSLAREHVEGTVSLAEAFRLGPDDLVYLSPLDDAAREGIRAAAREEEPVGVEEMRKEELQLTGRLRALGCRVSRYDVRSFVYY